MNTVSGAIKAADFAPALELPYKRFNTVLTIRGTIILAFLLFLFYSPVLKQTDIIAAVITYSLSAYIFLLVITTFLYSRKIKGLLKIAAFQPESVSTPGTAVTKSPALFLMRINEIYVPPGYYLEIQAEFLDENLKLSKHILSGRITLNYFLKEYITFPHRGRWKIHKINFLLSDKLNLTSFGWALSDDIGNSSPLVHPVIKNESALPVVSSSNRAGDTLPDLHEKNGDPYDLKAYHPSDGMKKILWKVYAKSGELISRHPEASMTPEGQVVVFAVAGKKDEEVCSSVLAYLKMLENLNLEILFSCSGAGLEKTAFSREHAEELLIDTVWDSENMNQSALERDFSGLIDRFKSKSSDARIERLVIFCSKQRLSTEEGANILIESAEYLERQSIKPFFCLISSFSIKQDEKPSNIFERLFLSKSTKPQSISSELNYDFLAVCKSRNWEYEEEMLE